MSRHKILLVDDETDFTTALSKRFTVRGMAVETAASGKEALEKVKEQDFDAVLLDIAMPGWDGVETLRYLIEERPDLQVVLLTGHATVKKGIEAMKLGALDLLEKPAEFQELLEKIEEASAKKAILVEKRIESKLDDILTKKSW
jgi:DNA-binding NtrC family response regulator